ncbi:unnamed protein product [Fusarium graminearum]|uniref:Chromosome 3, complete genome n=1 Tax=Gibberella zeae (strain ATCC MYA-4620 / CBS 123657 / FGSC 9075 / NRRL 31084 / PH-1) TaxID=229533 RepID=A0A1C3YJU6_GIBZE|nr:unnamed protein product [Fusarium graminearum]
MDFRTLYRAEEFLRPFMVTNPEDQLRFSHITTPPTDLIDAVRYMHDVPHQQMLFIVSPSVEDVEHDDGDLSMTTFTNCGMVVPKSQSLRSLFNAASLLKKDDGDVYIITHELGRTEEGQVFGRFWTSLSQQNLSKSGCLSGPKT